MREADVEWALRAVRQMLLANVRACANRARANAEFLERWLRRHEPPIQQFMDDDEPPRPPPKRVKR